ncbi:DUF5343 domain-containing protein, partial [Methylobacterium sp. P5_C11]
MSNDLPYVLGNARLPLLFDKITGAAKPEKFSQDFLEKLGFSSSNDRSFPRLLRFLGFLDENFRPNTKYDLLKDGSRSKQVLAEQIRESYNELFSINTEINKAPDQEIRGAIARITGKDETNVNRTASTFKTLCGIADFQHNLAPARPASNSADEISSKDDSFKSTNASTPFHVGHRRSEFHYNIQIHLPATTEIGVYQAIFKSLKET